MTKQKQNKTKVKRNTKIRQLEQQLAKVKIQAKTPFSNAGALVGARAGQMFNLPMLKGVGKWLGSGIGSIFGSGDYEVSGAAPSYNVLVNGNQIPKFTSTHSTNIVCHREYLGDITGTTAFTNAAYPLNPGMSTTFPWLSTIADNYQEYKFHGLIFEFRPLITDFVASGAPGVVVMATNYNADLPVYTSKQTMENSEFAVSVKPTNALMHGVECSEKETDPVIRYVRNGAVVTGQDLKAYDLGNFQFATQSNPVQNLGELWVSYCVEFFKPTLTTTSGPPVTAVTNHRYTTACTAASPLGTIQVTYSGGLAVTYTPTTITILAAASQLFMVNLAWSSGTVTFTAPTCTVTNGTKLNYYKNGAANTAENPQNALAGASQENLQFVAQATAAGNIVFTFGTSGVTGSNLDCWVSILDGSTTA
jgi:hypothetical protein